MISRISHGLKRLRLIRLFLSYPGSQRRQMVLAFLNMPIMEDIVALPVVVLMVRYTRSLRLF